MKHTYTLSLFLLLSLACNKEDVREEQQPNVLSLEQKLLNLKNPKEDYVLVASHRGNWQNHPENSLAAIQSCIDLGVDIVEIDVRKTKDGHLVLMHDSDVNRTTNGTGTVSSKTLAEIKQLLLVNKHSRLSEERVPTLKEAMELAKGKIIVMIDKANDSFEETLTVLKETQTLNQALFIEYYQYNEAISVMSSELFHNSLYVPRIKETVNNKQKYISPFIQNKAAAAFEIRFSTANSHTLSVIPQLKEANISIWFTTLSDDQSAGFTDAVSLNDPSQGWGKCIELGANILMTDYPENLIHFLNDDNKRIKN